MNKQSHNNHAQMAVDFLIGISLFIGVIILTFQFMGSSIQPFTQTSYEPNVMVHSGADNLQYDKFATGEPSRWNLSFLNTTDDTELRKTLGLQERDTRHYNFNITIRDKNGDIVDDLTFGVTQPDVGPQVAKATRTGYSVDRDIEVVMRVRIW